MFNIVLFNPEIPQNAGNIVRTAAATGSRVHFVRPMGFEVTDKHLKRAGLDYWHHAETFYYDSIEEVISQNPSAQFYFASTKGQRNYAEIDYSAGDVFVVFGPESKGLPEDLLHRNYENCIRIPTRAEARSLNLSNSVAIIVYEALRQGGFANLKLEGKLTSF